MRLRPNVTWVPSGQSLNNAEHNAIEPINKRTANCVEFIIYSLISLETCSRTERINETYLN